MKVAHDAAGKLVECDDDTPQHRQYRCIICDNAVYPRNELKKEHGRKRDYYFAHYNSDCIGGIESYIHKIAKQIILEGTEIQLPGGNVLKYATVEAECSSLHPSIRPDVLLENDLAVELFYRNKKKEREIAIYRQINFTAIEIDLSMLDETSSIQDIYQAVLTKAENRRYLFRKVTPELRGERMEWVPAPVAVLVFIIFLALSWLVPDAPRPTKRRRGKHTLRRR